MQSAYYLLKLRASSLTFPKNWEVGLKGRMTPASSIPLQSKDIALFQRDWDKSLLLIAESSLCRKTLPCSKGIETKKVVKSNVPALGRKTLPCSKGIETIVIPALKVELKGRKTLPCSKGIETITVSKLFTKLFCRKTLPCSKGIETY